MVTENNNKFINEILINNRGYLLCITFMSLLIQKLIKCFM